MAARRTGNPRVRKHLRRDWPSPYRAWGSEARGMPAPPHLAPALTAPPTMVHPGKMHFVPNEGLWVGETVGGHALSIRADFFDPDRLDAACEALALRELRRLEQLQVRVEEFLARSPISRPAHLLGGRWDLEHLHFTNLDHQGIVHDEASFSAEYRLRGDDHNVWVVRVEDGKPVKLSGR